ncbi:uncharacterized protein LOC123872063 [Maniola jurtina]|uniref:uncharacterized protein LOC123872063 n=1 Tax=Maniola jurtina TaxID=191418 RepID=UPI001E68810D|nr:uncharacterized protein LOC123872063 [Maniola jurtina]
MKLVNHCSVFQAELTAILRALRVLLIKKTPPKIANILSDSRSALQCIEDPDNLHPIVFEIRKTLEDLKEAGGLVNMFWVKAHAGIPGNERADEIAKKAALTKKSAPVYDALPVSSAKWILRQETLNKWQSKYTTEPQGAVTKRFFPDIRQSYPIVKKLKMNNQLAQLLTGHGGFGEYLHKYKLKDNPFCNCDGVSPESVVHVICKCPKFAYDRAKVELMMGYDVLEENFRNIIANSKCREIFLKFALKIIRSVNKNNKSTSI